MPLYLSAPLVCKIGARRDTDISHQLCTFFNTLAPYYFFAARLARLTQSGVTLTFLSYWPSISIKFPVPDPSSPWMPSVLRGLTEKVTRKNIVMLSSCGKRFITHYQTRAATRFQKHFELSVLTINCMAVTWTFFSGISEAELTQDSAVDLIVGMVFQKDSLSVVIEAYRAFIELWNTRRSNNETMKNF